MANICGSNPPPHIERVKFRAVYPQDMRHVPMFALLFAVAAFAQTPPAWVEKSNRNAQLLIDINARYSPESATSDGVKGLDDRIFSLAAGQSERERADLRKARQELESRLAKEQDPLVK